MGGDNEGDDAAKGGSINSLRARCGRKGVQEQSAAMLGGNLPNLERGS
jgi:hypothetical protein